MKSNPKALNYSMPEATRQQILFEQPRTVQVIGDINSASCPRPTGVAAGPSSTQPRRGHQGFSYLQVLLFSLDALEAQVLRVFSGLKREMLVKQISLTKCLERGKPS